MLSLALLLAAAPAASASSSAHKLPLKTLVLYENGLGYFERKGTLPEGWQPMRGTTMKGSFDWRCCQFLKIDYAALEAETLKGNKTDAELVAWAFQYGRQPDDQEIEVWNAFMTKRGWRDAGTQRLNERLAEIGLPPGTVQTMFEFIDLDEGRRQVGPR